jgi:signal transduction histidine kinase
MTKILPKYTTVTPVEPHIEPNVTQAPRGRTRYEHALEAVDASGICLMRCALAISGLFVLLTRPALGRMGTWEYALLFCYSAYSAVLYYHASRHKDPLQSKATHWVDVAWYLALISLSGGTKSVFFLFFFFAILVSSFRWGFGEGMRVAVASAALSASVGFAVLPATEEWYVLQPIYLVVLGYLIARWGESEILLKKRLTLLRELNRLSNPRFGVEQAIGTILERLRVFYDADTCLAIMRHSDVSWHMHLADGNAAKPLLLSQPVPQEMSRILLAVPQQCAAVYNASTRWSFNRRASWQVHCIDAAHPEPGAKLGEEAADMLDTRSFVSVPLQRNAGGGRLYVTSSRNTFMASDMHFIRQLAAQLAPVIENIQLLDRIASDAAGDERQKISRDLHDSTIQPYVGLKIGLQALRRKVHADNPIAKEIDDLCEMTQHGIGELRRYVADLRSPANNAEADFLFREVWKQAERFKTFHGIEVEVNASPNGEINDRLAAEVIQIVSEGLNNIKRHTASRRATVNLRRHEYRYITQIINHGPQSPSADAFVPRSISERAQHLGGKVDVQQWQDGTAVTVEIPL